MIHKLTLDRLEDDRAILLTTDYGMVTIPASLLPAGIETGQPLYFELKASLTEESANEHLAKAVLNELLKTDE